MSKRKDQSQRKNQFGFRANTQLTEEINSYIDENNLSQSDALRDLVKKGLRVDKMEERQEQMEERVERLEEQLGNQGLLSFLR